jgi:DNA-binding HxlR family transcriptional regulator
MPGYGQFCPVAKAMEILDERWTMLIVREILSGSTRFNDVRRGVPRMSPTLLTRRLRELERLGLIERRSGAKQATYHATPRCEELRPIVEAIGVWGLRWIGELGEQDLDPHLLLWDMRRTVPVIEWPRSRTTLAIRFEDVEPASRNWWFVVAGEDVDVCEFDPGYPVIATVRTQLVTLTRIWRGDMRWDQATKAELVQIDAPSAIAHRVPRWLGVSNIGKLAGPQRPDLGVPA